MQSKQDQLKTQYLQDADNMAAKPRFGFFSIYPSNRAGITDYAQKKAQKDQTGRVKTGIKGIYSGVRSVKVLSRTCFSEITSPFIGCPYGDPKKVTKKQNNNIDKEVFRPARLQKTLYTSAYKYICIRPQDKANFFRDQNGKVITKSPNICSNPISKIDHKRDKDFKYMPDPYQNQNNKRKQQLNADLAKRGEPFRPSSPIKQYFTIPKKIFDDTSNVVIRKSQDASGASTGAKKLQISRNSQAIGYKHEAKFRPSSGKFTKFNGCFNKLTYKQQGQPKKRPQTAEKLSSNNDNNNQSFKKMTKFYNSKPCPSISLNKMNIMRKVR